MCLAIPACITAIEETTNMATVSLGGVKKDVSLALVDGACVGDYVLIHVGYALNLISKEEAEQTLSMMAEAGLSEVRS
jgi:hydrogenase expression/formation protein HypC